MAQPVGVQPPRTDTQASGATGFVLRPLWRWFALAVVALVLVEAALAWANLSPVVRRRSSNALILTGLALVLIILALARVPLPALKSGGSFTWVGRPSTAARYERLIAAAPGWTSRWVSRSPLVDAPASDQAVTPSSPQPALGSSDLGVAIEMALASPAE